MEGLGWVGRVYRAYRVWGGFEAFSFRAFCGAVGVFKHP